MRVRAGGGVLVGLLVPLVVTLANGGAAWHDVNGASNQNIDARAQKLLARARNVVGGAGRLAAIERLVVETTERPVGGKASALQRTYRLLLPDSFQSTVPGVVAHTLDRGSFWMDRSAQPDTIETAERSTRARFLIVSVAFLLRAPDERRTPVRALGRMRVQGMEGEVLEFQPPTGSPLGLMVSPESGMPMCLIVAVRAASSGQPGQATWRLEDYRDVQGLRFPFRLALVPDEASRVEVLVTGLVVNPLLVPEHFRQSKLSLPAVARLRGGDGVSSFGDGAS